MKNHNRFAVPGSPLNGRAVPPDWKDLDHGGKKARCVLLGWARDLYEAGVLLAKHAGAAAKGRSRCRKVAHHAPPKWWDR